MVKNNSIEGADGSAGAGAVPAAFAPVIRRAMGGWRLLLAIFGPISAAGALILLAATMAPRPADALPSFARQTGQPCAACHTAFPELTPFGRRFKLGGYTLGGGDAKSPHVAAMILPTFTHTTAKQDAPPADHTRTNDNTILQQASVFYGGQIYGNLGAFVQGTFDFASNRFFLDNTDIRYADTTKLGGMDVLYGLTINNTPTVQDVWNTTTAWGFPEVGATLAPQFAPPGTMIEGGFAGQVIGTGVYTFWNDMLYAEITGYHGLSVAALSSLGEPDPGLTNGLPNIAPYWRLAIEPTFGPHSIEIGTFGMMANVYPGRDSSMGTDRITDYGFDSQYQYNGDMNSFTVKVTDIIEQQHLGATFALGNSSNINDRLNSFKISGSWVYDHTYSLSAGMFDVAGTADATLYGGGAAAGTAMALGKPNGRGLLFDAAYLPFSHGGPKLWPWANARIGVSYTHYLKLYGGNKNFDGMGHNATGNDTLFLYSWIAF